MTSGEHSCNVAQDGPGRAAGLLVERVGREKRWAILFGWTCSQLRHVAKHAAAWHALGVSTVTVTTSAEETFLPRALTGLHAKMERVLAVPEEAGATAAVAHLFSNGGALSYLTALELLRRRPPESGGLRLIGTVYDSAPSRPFSPLYAPLVVGMSGLPPRELARSMAATLPFAVAATAGAPLFGNPLSYFGELRDARLHPPRPELFLYSAADALIPAADVEQFAAERRAAGAAVTLKPFAGSPHVAHYRAYPEDYAAAIRTWSETELGT